MTEFLLTLLTEAYPDEQQTEAPEPRPYCEWCNQEPPEGEDLMEVDDSDPSVGYRSTILMCANCRYYQGIQKARGY